MNPVELQSKLTKHKMLHLESETLKDELYYLKASTDQVIIFSATVGQNGEAELGKLEEAMAMLKKALLGGTGGVLEVSLNNIVTQEFSDCTCILVNVDEPCDNSPNGWAIKTLLQVYSECYPKQDYITKRTRLINIELRNKRSEMDSIEAELSGVGVEF